MAFLMNVVGVYLGLVLLMPVISILFVVCLFVIGFVLNCLKLITGGK